MLVTEITREHEVSRVAPRKPSQHRLLAVFSKFYRTVVVASPFFLAKLKTVVGDILNISKMIFVFFKAFRQRKDKIGMIIDKSII